MTTTKSVLVSKPLYWPVCTVHRSIACFRTVDRWPYFHWFNNWRDVEASLKILGLDGRRYWKHLMDIWVEGVNKKILQKMWVYNERVINSLLGQQQICLTLERSRVRKNCFLYCINKDWCKTYENIENDNSLIIISTMIIAIIIQIRVIIVYVLRMVVIMVSY